MMEQSPFFPKPEQLPTRSGGSFLLESGEEPIFVLEGMTELQSDFRDAAKAFMEGEILPQDDALDSGDPQVQVDALRKACELGLGGIEVSEEHGGLGLDLLTSMLVVETAAIHASFSVSFGAHTSIGMLPVVYFGKEELKAKYLPRMVTGELISCYALTEPGSGSDALSARSRADLSEDGTHYILNGTKQFISNGAFADLAVVFAQVGGSQFSGFLVDLHADGVTVDPKEHKMGIRGSSTNALQFSDVKVPVDNLLGEVGKGHKIAFNILNIGRLKLACGSQGGSILAINQTLSYAKERKQFDTSISDFPAIREKFGRMATRTFAGQSLVYRTVGDIEHGLLSGGFDVANRWKGIEEFAAEAAISKVFGSEALGYVVDEGVQIHGGYGYIAEYPIERGYRDARINRIFEGTNEINRMLVPGTLLKRAMQGRLDLMGAAGDINEDINNEHYSAPSFEGALGHERTLLHLMRRRILYTMNGTAMKLQAELEKRQEVLMAIADAIIEFYAADSAVRHAQQLGAAPEGNQRFAWLCAAAQTREAWDTVEKLTYRVLWHISGTKGRAVHSKNLAVWGAVAERDILGLYQDLGAFLVERGSYPE